jgi:hypothetical protein
MEGQMSRKEIQDKLKINNKKYFISTYLQPALEQGYIATEFPTPNHPKQRYCLTEKGENIKQSKNI